MRKLSVWKITFLLIIGFTAIVIYSQTTSYKNRIKTNFLNDTNARYLRLTTERHIKKQQRVTVSFVVCDSRFNESLNVAKSVLIFTTVPVHFVIFADDELRPKLNNTFNLWKEVTNNKFSFELHEIKFPEEHKDVWMNLFRKCAAQRLFFPNILPHIDSMIYIDTDTLFLGPVKHLWDYFDDFNSTQISAMTLEDDNPNVSWYPRFAKHPFYGKYGLNSGVMLMNLTRMRDFSWVNYVTPILMEWRLYIPWGDQDIINVIFHYNPKAVYVLSCRYNYRTDQCMYGDACSDATKDGVFLVHGSRKAFHNSKQPAFEALYRAIDEHVIGKDTVSSVVEKIDLYISQSATSNCGNLREAFMKIPRLTANETLQRR